MAVYFPDSDRFTDYQPGVLQGIVGGIPDRSGGDQVDATAHGFDEGETEENNGIALTAACNAVLDGGVVNMPAGEFDLPNWSIPTLSTKSYTLRGAGMLAGGTILNVNGTLNMEASTNFGNPGNDQGEIVSMSGGSAVITLDDASGFPSPTTPNTYRLARIYLENEIVTPIAMPVYFPRIRFIDVIMISRSGNNITLAHPLPSDFTEGATGAWFELAISFAGAWRGGMGLEDFRVNVPDSPIGVAFAAHQGSWLKNIRIHGFNNYGIRCYDLVGCEIRGCWINGPGGLSSNNAGVLVNSCTYNLFEDNISVNTFPDWEVNSGSTSNIFTYNHGNGQFNVNHGPWNSFNLYEGNNTPFFHADGYFGGCSQETFYRNRSSLVPILKRFSRQCNIIGNLVTSLLGDGAENWGKPNIGNSAHNGEAQFSTGDYWRDWDVGTGRAKTWAATLTTRTDDTSGVLTLSTADADDLEDSLIEAASDGVRIITFESNDNGGSLGSSIRMLTRIGDTFTFDTWAGLFLPDVGVEAIMQPGPTGFQELDLDVAATLDRKANWRAYIDDIPAEEELDPGTTLADSYCYDSVPQCFVDAGMSSSWPPYDPFDPATTNVANRIPAEVRYNSEIPPEAPEFTVDPVISGTGALGSQITGTSGTVTGEPTPVVTNQWELDTGGGFADIVGATAINYTPPIGSDLGTIRLRQDATNGETPDAVAYSNEIELLPFMGDILTLNQTANTDPVTELVKRATVGGGAPTEEIIQHSGDYPSQPDNDYVYAKHGSTQKHVFVFEGTINLATAIASRP